MATFRATLRPREPPRCCGGRRPLAPAIRAPSTRRRSRGGRSLWRTARRRTLAEIIAVVVAVSIVTVPAHRVAQAYAALAERAPPGRQRALEVPVVTTPPAIDGVLTDLAWDRAAVGEGFWISEQERWPTEQTEVLVMADATHLYVAFKVFDSEPQAIEALQTRRDGALGFDDHVTVELDPFLTYREISTFSVNASGTQADSFAGGRASQVAWKGDWQAAVARTSYGWAAEIAIPFEILNFQAGIDEIGVNFVRYHHRTAETSRWADITVRALPEEMGRLTGLRPAAPDGASPWTFLPYAMAGRHVPDRRGRIRDELVSAGVDIRYEPRPNLTGVVSLLPDFSQVEESLAGIDFSYNERFRSDLRPFFQEGAAYFGDAAAGKKASVTTPYFYSNRVPDFDIGAKAFGRADGLQFGALATRVAGERSDLAAHVQQQFNRTHHVSAMAVGTHRPDLDNALVALRAAGREPSGFDYALDAAVTRTDPDPGDGTYASAALGWAHRHWSVGGSASRYSRDFFPANGLLPADRPDTRGGTLSVDYYRERPSGALREVYASLNGDYRETGDGRLQRRKLYAAGALEWREPQVRVGATAGAGPYRPVGASPGAWSDVVNEDRYVTLAADFNTRSSRLMYGVAVASGELGGGDYRYASAYALARPARTLALALTTERLENFGTFRQTTLAGTWDVAPDHVVAGRVIDADAGRSYRLSSAWHVRKHVDLFVVYDRSPGLQAQLSAKVRFTY